MSDFVILPSIDLKDGQCVRQLGLFFSVMQVPETP